MGVQKDAGELLLFFYDEIVNHGKNIVRTEDVLNATRWEINRIKAAYTYLNDLNLFYGYTIPSIGDITKDFHVRRLLPKGINIVENEQKFKKTFGFEVKLGSLKFSWSTTEK